MSTYAAWQGPRNWPVDDRFRAFQRLRIIGHGAHQRTSTRRLNPRLPFSRAEALAAGLSIKTLTGKRFQKITWDSYLDRGVKITPQIRSRAALRLAPAGSHISHHTAAELWNAYVPGGPVTHLTTPSSEGRLVRKGIKSHYYDSHLPMTTLRNGLPVSTPSSP